MRVYAEKGGKEEEREKRKGKEGRKEMRIKM
jgi:hypothetical protein